MKVQRTKIRKIHESQRKLDNEEMSDEEEEDEFEDEDGTEAWCFTIIKYLCTVCIDSFQLFIHSRHRL